MALIEQVNEVCNNVRSLHNEPVTFKKLIASTKKQFKLNDIDLVIKTKKDKNLNQDEFYINAYYDAYDDSQGDPPIEVVIHHNLVDSGAFGQQQLTEFLIQIFDAVVHECRHQKQSKKRNYLTFSDHDTYQEYLADSDEVDAYALSIAIELLRSMPKSRVQRYMSRITVMSKMRQKLNFISPTLRSYIATFGLSPVVKKLAKKVYKHVDTLDKSIIFM